MTKKDINEDPIQLKIKIAELEEKIGIFEELEKNNGTLIEQLQALEAQLELLTNTSKRALADLENFKKRTIEEKKSLISFANESLILKLLPTLDNFERALNHTGDEKEKFIDGIKMIYSLLQKNLEEIGLEKFNSKGEKLDPNLHDALMQDNGDKDIILEELEQGYTLNGKVIRHAKVKVGNGST